MRLLIVSPEPLLPTRSPAALRMLALARQAASRPGGHCVVLYPQPGIFRSRLEQLEPGVVQHGVPLSEPEEALCRELLPALGARTVAVVTARTARNPRPFRSALMEALLRCDAVVVSGSWQASEVATLAACVPGRRPVLMADVFALPWEEVSLAVASAWGLRELEGWLRDSFQALRGFTRVFAPGEEEAEGLRRLLPEGPAINVFSPGPDGRGAALPPPPAERRRARELAGLPPERSVVLVPAPDHAAAEQATRRALGLLAPANADALFVVFGEGVPAVEHLAAANVRFLREGAVPQGLLEVACDAAVFAPPADFHGMTAVIREGLSPGLALALPQRVAARLNFTAGTHYYPLDDDPAGALWRLLRDEGLRGHLAHHARTALLGWHGTEALPA